MVKSFIQIPLMMSPENANLNRLNYITLNLNVFHLFISYNFLFMQRIKRSKI